MSLGNPTQGLRASNAPPLPPPTGFRHQSFVAEPTLPRLTRLGPPTLHSLDIPPSLPQTTFKPQDASISPSVYSVSSASSDRRRSSAGSDDGKPPSSRSSTSTHDNYAPVKQGPWDYSPVQERRPSEASLEAYPRQSYQNLVPNRGPPLGSQFPPRRPVAGNAEQRSHTPPLNQGVRPPLPPYGAALGPPPSARTFLRTPSPAPFDESTHPRRSPQPVAPGPCRAPSPAQLYGADHMMPQPRQQPMNVQANMSSPGFFQHMRQSTRVESPHMSPRKYSVASSSGAGSAYSSAATHSRDPSNRSMGTRASNLSGSFSQPPTPWMQSQRPQSPGFSSRPASPMEEPYSATEITALWSHASLLYHNGRVKDAINMLRTITERPGASELTLARLDLNVGIMTESLAKGRVSSPIPTHVQADIMMECFESAVKKTPDGKEGALGVFLMGIAFFDKGEFDKSASCFDMCEAIFAGEYENKHFCSSSDPWSEQRRPSALDGNETIDFQSLGMNWALTLEVVRENWRVAQERARIPPGLGTMRGLHRMPTGFIVEEPLQTEPAHLDPVDESDEEIDNIRSTLGLSPDDSELVPMRLDLGTGMPCMSPNMSQTRQSQQTLAGPPMRRRTTRKQDREEMERRREARRTRILIKLGDLRLNKPLPPLPHEREAMKRHERTKTPEVPAMPASIKGGFF